MERDRATVQRSGKTATNEGEATRRIAEVITSAAKGFHPVTILGTRQMLRAPIPEGWFSQRTWRLA
jgi:hypothetical protein